METTCTVYDLIMRGTGAYTGFMPAFDRTVTVHVTQFETYIAGVDAPDDIDDLAIVFA